MRIAIVAPEHPRSDRHGGIARYLRDYVPELARHADVQLVSIEDGPPLDGVPQTCVDAGRVPSPLAAPGRSRRCRRALERIRPDVVEYANWLALGCADTGPWAKVMRLSTPVTHATLRPGLLPRLARPLHRYWERRAVRRMDACISNTAANVETCRAAYGGMPPCTVIPHGVVLQESAPCADAHGVLFVGRFEARKGLDVLLRAWATVLAETDVPAGVALHLVGRDTPGARGGSYLQDVLGALRLPAGRLVVHGDLSEAELAAVRRECVIGVVPSRYESFGMVVLECFAAGLAVIASRAGGLAEVVEAGHDGSLVTPGDAAALGAELRRLLADAALRARFVDAGRQALRTKYSVAEMTRRSLAVYAETLARRHGLAATGR